MSTPRLYGNPPKCSAHSNAGSGCARFHVDGCVVCCELRARGVVKPNAPDAPARKRGGMTTAGKLEPAATARPRVSHGRDGRMLCHTHRTSGAPMYHTPGCDACEEARRKGITRPDIDSVPRKLRGRKRYGVRNIDWKNIPKEERGRLADAISSWRFGEG
jgi:hypothetical protein